MAELRLEIDLAHPPERAWRALTDARLLGEWFMPTDLEPQEGARFRLEPGSLAGFLGPISGELAELAAPRRMVMLWRGEELYSRVTWELAETGAGCTIRVLQTGFLGAPATPRCRALRDTYTRLFTDRLPAVLDRLAAEAPPPEGAGAAGAAGGEQTGTGPAGRSGAAANVRVPRQRRFRSNLAIGAWSAGRSLPIPAATGTEPAGPTADRPEAGRVVTGVPPGPAEPAGAVGAAVVTAGRPSWWGRLATVPGGARALAIGAAAALLSVTVLIMSMGNPGGEFGLADPGTGGEGLGDAPAPSLQPGAVTSRNSPPAPAPPPGQAPGVPPASAAVPQPAGGDEPGPAAGADGSGEAPAGISAPAPAGAPVLTASMTTSGLPLVGGRSVEVTVANPGPGTPVSWEVVLTVGDQSVTKVTGAEHRSDGANAVFTPVETGPAAGESTRFSFEIPAPVLGLAGAEDPTDCTIDGRSCA